ncbi:hypothetical protein Pcinc_007406 [Petrolisthes cinctipes]|uniref:Uncharacterized protein n=1 Tax=Petrolisthes cinctipes TaxID=88211 RepID=A0AAE1G8N1_PETCI|nr:hypothetical protein Pcinc_007406 [Petrolisthes cinctipes]
MNWDKGSTKLSYCRDSAEKHRQVGLPNLSSAADRSLPLKLRLDRAGWKVAATSEERLQRLESDRAHKAVKRAAETSEERLQHLESDRAHKAIKRAAETSEECLQHFESDRAHTASTRAAET